MLLDGKQAVIYGGGGAVGGGVARGFAREGATVHLAGRTQSSLDVVADDIRAAGGTAHTAVVDALDEAAVDRFTDAVASEHGSLDISFDVITANDVQGTPLAEMSLEDFEAPIRTLTRTMFITARAAARHMLRQGSGVILAFGGEGDPIRDYHIGGFQIALTAIEALQRQLASELGPHGIRVVSLLTGGIAEGIPEGFEGRAALEEMLTKQTLLGRCATFQDVSDVACFVASDKARTITATAINITCGAIVT